MHCERMPCEARNVFPFNWMLGRKAKGMGYEAMIRRYISLGLVVILSLCLAGCYTDFGPVAGEPDPIPFQR